LIMIVLLNYFKVYDKCRAYRTKNGKKLNKKVGLVLILAGTVVLTLSVNAVTKAIGIDTRTGRVISGVVLGIALSFLPIFSD
ncbi:MAG: hypothetical protein WCQ72_03415, partial [Eubacteriales bacterium]